MTTRTGLPYFSYQFSDFRSGRRAPFCGGPAKRAHQSPEFFACGFALCGLDDKHIRGATNAYVSSDPF
jgi:hypothetical protein